MEKMEVVEGLKYRTIDTLYDLFFTDDRFVAAIVLHPSDLSKMYSKHSFSTILIGGTINEAEIKALKLKVTEERREEFKDKTVDEILAMHKANFEVKYRDVRSITLKKGLLTSFLKFLLMGPPETEISFWIDRKQIPDIEETVRKFLPNRLK